MSALIQRPLRGSRISSFYPVKTLPPLASLDSAFQLQEYISLLIRLDVHDVDHIVAVPGKVEGEEKDKDKEKEKEKEKKAEKEKEVVVDQACWIYEQLRRLAQDLTHPLITTLQQECTRVTCPEMKAGEWLYLCVAHGTDGAMEQCCAIDYILHTLDSATALLNSPRAFPSRLHIDKTSHRHFSSLARRLGRIFAHAYFHHREAFEQAEAESSLYARFLALTTKFELVPAEFQVIPSRADDMDVPPPRLLAAAVDSSEYPSTDDDAAGEPEPEPEPRAKSSSPPGLRTGSPRKMGRNRTDTMVYSEAFSVVEELAREEDAIVASFTEEKAQDKPLSPEPPILVDEPQALDVMEASLAQIPQDAMDEEALRPEPEMDSEMNVTASSSTALDSQPPPGSVEIVQDAPVTEEPTEEQALPETAPPEAAEVEDLEETPVEAAPEAAEEISETVEATPEVTEVTPETIEASEPTPVPAAEEDVPVADTTPTPTPTEVETPSVEEVAPPAPAPVEATPEPEHAPVAEKPVEPTPAKDV